MTIDDVYSLIKYIINKQQIGYLNPDEFNLIINQAQTSFLDYLLGEFQQYQPGKSEPRIGFGQNQTVRQRLTPFIYGYILNVDGNGFSPYPDDFQQIDAMWSMYGFDRIKYVQQDSLYSTYNSVIDPIGTNNIYLVESSGFQFYPTTIGQARLSYVRKPAQARWAYTNDIYSRPVYDPSQSINLEWYDVDILEIIARALRMVGVNLQAVQVSQYAEEVKNNGQ